MANEEEELDPVIRAIKKTGCLDFHNAVQECINEHKDWRLCSDQVKEFKSCLAEHQKTKNRLPMFQKKNSNDDQKNG